MNRNTVLYVVWNIVALGIAGGLLLAYASPSPESVAEGVFIGVIAGLIVAFYDRFFL